MASRVNSNGNNLSVPLHSRNASSTSSSFMHQRTPSAVGSNLGMGGSRNKSSAQLSFRLSRTNTQDLQSLGGDSIRTVDKILSSKPSVTYMDKLWTQIDVLDDVKRMSEEVKRNRSFFNDRFDAELEKLKLLQNKLLEVMSRQHFNNEEENEHQKQLYRMNAVHPEEGTTNFVHKLRDEISEKEEDDGEHIEMDKSEQEKTVGFEDHGDSEKMKERAQKLNQFFDDIATNHENTILSQKTDFSELEAYVEDIKENLALVGDSMKAFDQMRKELW